MPRGMRTGELPGNSDPLALRKLIAKLLRHHRPPDVAGSSLSEKILRLFRQHCLDKDLEDKGFELSIDIAGGCRVYYPRRRGARGRALLDWRRLCRRWVVHDAR